ncbi:hypothetical protein Ae505Ps2_4793c [Pseudonocardia sp. Ae505_Ps2]|nr:hypothetical protein Ae505Ps2_4793c [Pseudonocardia sp. Ae505_Ps2]
MNPHTTSSPTRKPGPRQAPPPARSRNRCAGSASTTNGTCSTASVSAGSTACSRVGVRQCPSTAVTWNPVSRISRGSVATTSTPDGSSPVSSVASRSAVAAGSVSPGSARPPGKEISPEWWRSRRARRWSTTSGPSGPCPSSTSTADCRGPTWSAGRSFLLMSRGPACSSPRSNGTIQSGARPGSGRAASSQRRAAATSHIRLGDHLEEVTGRVEEVHPAPAVPVVDLAGAGALRVGPVLGARLDEPGVRAVEQRVVDEERVVLGLDLRVDVGGQVGELDEDAAVEGDVGERPPRTAPAPPPGRAGRTRRRPPGPGRRRSCG